jgi:hypothetical protein
VGRYLSWKVGFRFYPLGYLLGFRSGWFAFVPLNNPFVLSFHEWWFLFWSRCLI